MKQTIALAILKYIRFWARLQLKKINPTIIGITGSAGKTSARCAIAQVLALKGSVKESHKANSESGIPLNVLGLQLRTYSPLDWLRVVLLAPAAFLVNWRTYDYYIAEMGVDSPNPPKNMGYLLTILRPHVGVMLNASLVHSATFDHLVKDRNPLRRNAKIVDEIAKEKAKLITTMGEDGVAIANTDQKEIRGLTKRSKARLLTFGKNKTAMVRIRDVAQSKRGFETTIEYNGRETTIRMNDMVLERNYAYTFAAACAVGIAFGISMEKSARTLEQHFTPPPGRWSLFEGKKDTHIIDSSYNASPTTMKEALESLKILAGKHRKIAVIGEMRELGDEAKKAHKDLASWILANANQTLLFGSLTREYTLPILTKRGFDAQHFATIEGLVKHLRDSLRKNAWILVKGSQNTILLERAVEAILKSESDVAKLCRRGTYWDRMRKKLP